MLIRAEIGVDAQGIHGLLRRCFPTGAEAELVRHLHEDGQLTLGLVATNDQGRILGYAAFSPVTLCKEDRQWLGLAPLAVDEQCRRQGIGSQLVQEGLNTLNEFGYAAVVVLGDVTFYRRLGFEPAADYHLHCQWPEKEAAFQVYKLAPNAFNDVSGVVHYHSHFTRFG